MCYGNITVYHQCNYDAALWEAYCLETDMPPGQKIDWNGLAFTCETCYPEKMKPNKGKVHLHPLMGLSSTP